MSTEEERTRWAADAHLLGGEAGNRVLCLIEDIENLEAKLAFAAELNGDLKRRISELFDRAKS